MKKNRVLCRLSLSCLLISVLRADTLTLRNNSEINGRVSYSDGAFTVAARYKAGSQTRTFDKLEVRVLELNKRDFNPGAPPKEVSIFDERASATKDASHDTSQKKPPKANSDSTMHDHSSSRHSVFAGDYDPTADVIWLRNKTKLVGRLVKIENGQITFQSGKKDKSLQSGEVATVAIAPN